MSKKWGVATYYYSNGKISAEGNFYKDIKNGKWYYYNEDERLTRREIHRKGKVSSAKTYKKGKMRKKSPFKR